MFLFTGGVCSLWRATVLTPHPPLQPGVRGDTAGSPLVLSRFNSPGLGAGWPLVRDVLPRRMINSILHSALAWAVILSLCRRRCYIEGPDKAVIEWRRMHAATHPAAHMTAGLSAQVPFIWSRPGLQNICCKFISQHHHQFLHPCCIRLLLCLEWCGVPCLP